MRFISIGIHFCDFNRRGIIQAVRCSSVCITGAGAGEDMPLHLTPLELNKQIEAGEGFGVDSRRGLFHGEIALAERAIYQADGFG